MTVAWLYMTKADGRGYGPYRRTPTAVGKLVPPTETRGGDLILIRWCLPQVPRLNLEGGPGVTVAWLYMTKAVVRDYGLLEQESSA